MSSSGENAGLGSSETEPRGHGNICRDFLNNICNRGSHCKFFHPKVDKPKEEYNFCIDFQNSGCLRENCRFVHASAEDAENYKRVGDISLSLARAIAIATQSDTINGIPICKEFLKGTCTRETRCRFWHIDPRSEAPRSSGGGGHASTRMNANRLNSSSHVAKRPGNNFDRYDVPAKRPTPNFGAFAPPPPSVGRYDSYPQDRISELERRNAELTVEVESLKRELQREKDRYTDLMLIFRESNAAAVAAATVQQQQKAINALPASWTLPHGLSAQPPPPSDSTRYGW